MKRSKKLLLVFLSVLMVLMLVGCGGGQQDPVVGNWKFTEGSMGGMTVTAKDAGMEFSLNFKADGTLEGDLMGEKATGKWKKDGDKYTVDIGGEAVPMTLKDGKLTLDYQGVQMKLEKAK